MVLLRLSKEGKATHDENTRAEPRCSLAAFASEKQQQGLAVPWVKTGVSPTSSPLPRELVAIPTARRNTGIRHVSLAHSHVPCAPPESPQFLGSGSWDLSPPRRQKGIRTRAGPGARLLSGDRGRWCPLAPTQPGWKRQRAGCRATLPDGG